MTGLEQKKKYIQTLSTLCISIVCAMIVVLMRTGHIPSIYRIQNPSIMVPFSDFFVIICAGLCGYKYGVLMFEIIFWAEFFMRGEWATALFSLFLYLVVAIVSGYIAESGWYKSFRKILAAFVVIELVLGLIFYSIFSFMYQSETFGAVQRRVISLQTLPETLFGVMPETVLAVLFLALYYRLVPEKIRKYIGIGYVYSSDYISKEIKTRSTLAFKTTVMLLGEAIVLSLAAAFFSQSLIGGYTNIETAPMDGVIIALQLIFIIMSISLPIAFLINEIMERIMVRPVSSISHYMSRYFEENNTDNALKISEAEQLSIQSNDEIGELYFSMKRMVQGMSDYIDTREKLIEAEAGSEAKSAFLSSMSHEIRTPINAVLGMDEMILRDTKEEQTYEYAENIRVAGNTLLNLINDVLDFSKIEAGKMDIIPVEYDPASLVHDLVTMISLRAEKKGLMLQTKIDPDIPSVLYGDEIRIKQVITNILTNAVKYTEKGGVTLSVCQDKGTDDTVNLHVSVKDTGIGIRQEDLGRLFSAFERIEEKRNRNIEGTGLGMNITTRLLDMMGSSLEVTSVYGEGSDFSFTLAQRVISWEPIGDYEARWKESVNKSRTSGTDFAAPQARILAVDDMPMNLSVLTGLLKPTGMQIDTADSGAKCLELVKDNRYDLIFLDHRMPEMDGVETLKRMKEGILADEKTPVIALTANAVSGAKEEYIGYGFTDYLTKPVSFASLKQTLLKYLPQDKISETSEESIVSQSRENKEVDLPVIDGFDAEYALIHVPDKELLLSSIKDFYQVIELHADRLDEMYERLPDDKAFDDYRVLVHGMKGNAATIGIIPLAGMAKILENAAAGKDAEMIRHLHGDFVHTWRGYRDKIAEAIDIEADANAEKTVFDSQEVMALLNMIALAMEDFDLDRADEDMKRLQGYTFPQAMKEDISKLSAYIAAVDDEGALKTIENIKEFMEEMD